MNASGLVGKRKDIARREDEEAEEVFGLFFDWRKDRAGSSF